MNGIILALFISLSPFSSKELKITRYGEVIKNNITQEERDNVSFIIDNCPQITRKDIDPYDVLVLTRLEKEFGLPKRIKNILPAIFCMESKLQKGYNLFGDQGRALGPAQLHLSPYRTCIKTNWYNYKGTLRIDNFDYRNDFIFSARCWITNTVRVLKRIERECLDLNEYDKWKVAEANVANWVKYKNNGCKAKSRHFELLENWNLNKNYSE